MISVLYVDDEPGLLELGKIFLEQQGDFHISTINSAEQALEKIRTTHFDAIISDYQMPEMDGIAFLKEVRSAFGDIPFILFTGRGREEVVIQAINSGADFYLQKGGENTAQFAELAHKIRQAAARRKAAEQVRESERTARALLDASSDAAALVDGVRCIIAANEAFAKRFGKSPQELTGVSLSSILPAEIVETRGRHIEEAMKQKTMARFEDQRGDLWLENSIYPVSDEHGAITRLAIYSRDITARKQAEIEIRDKTLELQAAYQQLKAAEEELRKNYDQLARSEQQLRVSEDRYRSVVETQTEFISRFTPDGIHVFANDAYLRYFNKTPDTLIGKRFIPEIPPAERALIRDHLAGLTRENPSAAVEHRIITPDGRVRWQQWNDTAIFNNEGILVEYQSVGRDITDIKTAEEAIRKSQAFYRSVFENTLYGIAHTGPDFCFILVNDAFCRMMEYSRDELVDKLGIPDVTYPDDRPASRENVEHLIRHETDHFVMEKRYVTRSGKTIFAITFVQAFYDDRGKYQGSTASIMDVTDRKKMEIELVQSENLYRTILDNMQDVYYRSDSDGTLILASPSLARLLGYDSLDDMYGKNIAGEFYRNPDERQRFLDAVYRDGSVLGFEVELKCRDGSSVSVETNSHLYFDNTGKIAGVEGILRDITTRKAAAAALQKEKDFTRLLLDASPTFIVAISAGGRTLTMNRALLDALEYSAGEVEGADYMTTFVPAQDRESLSRVFSQIVTEGKATVNENRIISKSGRIFNVRWHGRAVKHAEGFSDFFVGVGIDITGQKLPEMQ